MYMLSQSVAINVPLAMRSKIVAVLDILLADDVAEYLSNSSWTAPVVAIIKPSGEIHLCGDYKMTLNTSIKNYSYPVFYCYSFIVDFKRWCLFCKIDLAQIYFQLVVGDKLAKTQIIVTDIGSYKVMCLQYGYRVAPDLFQNLIGDLIEKIEGVNSIFYDVFIQAKNMEELSERL